MPKSLLCGPHPLLHFANQLNCRLRYDRVTTGLKAINQSGFACVRTTCDDNFATLRHLGVMRIGPLLQFSNPFSLLRPCNETREMVRCIPRVEKSGLISPI